MLPPLPPALLLPRFDAAAATLVAITAERRLITRYAAFRFSLRCFAADDDDTPCCHVMLRCRDTRYTLLRCADIYGIRLLMPLLAPLRCLPR